jgi:hypothetical protein
MESENERYVGQRGPDKESREFNPKSLLNLKQFQKNLGTGTDSSVNLGINWIKIGIVAIVAIVISVLAWKLYQRKKKSERRY